MKKVNGRMGNRWVAAVAALGIAITGFGALGVAEAEAYVPHAALVPELPALGFPKILNTPTYVENNATVRRQVRATDQVGRFIVAGGEFHEIELQNGTVLQQKYFAAFNIDTKQIVCQGQLTFDNDVLAVAPGPTDTKVFVAGRFAKITGADGVQRTRIRVGLVDLSNCSVDTTFVSIGANGKINEMTRVGNRLFVAGDFTAIGGVTVETVAELNATNAVVNAAFNFPTAGEMADRVRGLAANPDGTRLYLGGRFGTISGSGRNITAPSAVFDITNAAAPVLTAHQASGYAPIADLQDVAYSPDGAFFGSVYGTATSSDYAYYTPTVESATSYQWRHYMRDSMFSVAITNNAMYIGGHFCRPDAGPGPTEEMTPKMGFDSCTGTNSGGGVWRSHLAALSLTDGTPLTWNPGQDSFVGARRITATTRGLLVGFDGERTNDIRTGALAFFDFGPAVEDTTPPSDVTFTAPSAGSSIGNPATISGTASDNFAVVRYELSLQASNGQYVQPDGTLGAAFSNFSITAAANGSFSTTLALPVATYTARARAVDSAGLKSANQTALVFTENGTEAIAPVATVSTPAAPVNVGGVPAISGTATDNVAVQSVGVTVRNLAGLYLQPDGSYSLVPADLPITITSGALATPALGWSLDLGNALPIDSYTVQATVTDPSANTTVATGSFSIEFETVAPTIGLAVPPAPVTVGSTPPVSGTASDNTTVQSLTVRVRNAAGLYVQADRSLAATVADYPFTVTSGAIGSTSVGWSIDLGNALPVDTYTVEYEASDQNNNKASTTGAFVIQVVPPRLGLTNVTNFDTRSTNLTMGYTFRVNQTITVNALGVYDTNNNGVLNNPSAAGVGIWRSNGQLLGSVSVPNTATADNRWFYVNLATPITLTPGNTYYIGQQQFSNGELYARNASLTADPAISPQRRASSLFNGFTFPLATGGGGGLGVPNFKFTV